MLPSITNIMGGNYSPYNYNQNLTSSINDAVAKAINSQAVVSKPAAQTVNTAPTMEDFIKTLPSMQQNARMFSNNPIANQANNPADVLRNSYSFAAGQVPQLSQVMQQGAVPGGGPAPQQMQQSDVKSKLAQLLGG